MPKYSIHRRLADFVSRIADEWNWMKPLFIFSFVFIIHFYCVCVRVCVCCMCVWVRVLSTSYICHKNYVCFYFYAHVFLFASLVSIQPLTVFNSDRFMSQLLIPTRFHLNWNWRSMLRWKINKTFPSNISTKLYANPFVHDQNLSL